MRPLTVGYLPFNPGDNPYQTLFANALERAGLAVDRIPARKLLPLQFAARSRADLLQLDWPHDWYRGRIPASRIAKRLMYLDGLRRIHSRPVVWTAHNLSSHDTDDAEYERRMIQALVDVCDGIIVLSDAAGSMLRAMYDLPSRARVRTIYHGHYIDVCENHVTREVARKQLGIPESSRVVVSIGRLAPYKGLELLVDSFRMVAAPGDVLLLAGKAGSPEYADRLSKAAERASVGGLRVEVHNYVVPRAQLQKYFNASDVVALPFRNILNSGSLMLAMSFGCPVIAPNLGSIAEVACPEGWYRYESSDPEGLSTALRDALLQGHILEFTSARYGWQEIGQIARNLYMDIVG
jgi:glycosyltransferase involved in cell wall biosynthesis